MFGLFEKKVNYKHPIKQKKAVTIDVKKEIDRRRSQSARILDLLKQDVFVTNVDLQRIAFNYTMRVSELRKSGHIILAEYVSPGVFRYVYKGVRG